MRGYNCVAPWMNPEQFRKVYKYLYSKSISNKRWAVDQIAVWETRCYPALPTAVEATLVLVRAVIQDMLFEVEKTLCVEGDIQMLYSMALIRFVNVTLEHQQSDISNLGIYTRAAQQNIPSWIVDLRHDASHNFNPSLPVLRMGAEKALCYLEDTFWKVEAAKVQSIIYASNGCDETILNLIIGYKNLQFERLEDKSMRMILLKDVKTILAQINFYIENYWKTFVNILSQPNVFTAAEDLIRLLKNKDPFYLEDEENLSLPKILESFWVPLLRLIHQKDMIPNFVESLLIAQEKCKIPISQKTVIAWAMQIFMGPATSSPLGMCFKEKGLLFDLHRLLYACLKSTNPYSMHFFEMIIKGLGDIKKYSHLFCIMALYHGMFVSEKQNSHKSEANKEIIFTIEDVEEDLKEIKRTGKPAVNKDNIWSLVPVNMDFSNIPLGAILNRNYEKNSEMELDESEGKGTDFGPHPDDDFIILNENDDEGTIEEVTVDTNMFSASFLPEQFGMLYSKRD